jgi:hypothetical protein
MKSLQKVLSLKLVALLLTTLWGGQVLAENFDVEEGQGVIHELLIDTNSLVIDGVMYSVAYDAQVQIRGSYGAYGMLQSGMKVEFEYRRFSPDSLEIFHIEQLPDNTVLEES